MKTQVSEIDGVAASVEKTMLDASTGICTYIQFV